MLKFIKFYNLMTDSVSDGFITKEDEEFFYTIDPICYEWLLKKNKLEWLDHFEAKKFDKSFFSYHFLFLNENWTFMREKEWLLDFPLKDKHKANIPFIANYFEWFVSQRSVPLHEKIRKAKEMTSSLIPDELQKELHDFIIEHYRNDPNRIRTLLKGEA